MNSFPSPKNQHLPSRNQRNKIRTDDNKRFSCKPWTTMPTHDPPPSTPSLQHCRDQPETPSSPPLLQLSTDQSTAHDPPPWPMQPQPSKHRPPPIYIIPRVIEHLSKTKPNLSLKPPQFRGNNLWSNCHHHLREKNPATATPPIENSNTKGKRMPVRLHP